MKTHKPKRNLAPATSALCIISKIAAKRVRIAAVTNSKTVQLR